MRIERSATLRTWHNLVPLQQLTTGVSLLLIATLASLFTLTCHALATEPDTFSPVVSFQYQESLADSETIITSSVVSFQYYEWPGNENLTFQNSPAVSYQYHDTSPQIVVQPMSQLLRVGAIATLAVTAAGPPPLSYQWIFNGQPIANATGISISRLGLKNGVAGSYSVVVSNGYGSTPSATAQLIVYDAPATVKPALPSLVSVFGSLSPAQTAIPRLPSSTQLKVMSGTMIDPNKMTIVMTHGWMNSSADWPTMMAAALAPFADTANILAWDWTDNAHLLLSSSASRTVSEGMALGSALMDSLGPYYDKPIHFMGHSLGTIVNCTAANYIHGDHRPHGDLRPDTEKYSPTNTQMTLFDEAELVTAVKGLRIMADVLLGGSNPFAVRDSLDQATNFFSHVIPAHSRWIDNYISLVGIPHPEAANVMLWRNNYLDVLQSHGYAVTWYQATVANPGESDMGSCWSFERGTILQAPLAPSYFLQSIDLNEGDNVVSQTNFYEAGISQMSAAANRIVAYPTKKIAQGLSAVATVVSAVSSPTNTILKYVGSIGASIGESFSTPKDTPVYLDTAGSTAAYFVPTGQTAANSLQANWDLQFNIQQGTVQPQKIQNGIRTMALNATASGPVYTIIPVHVPNEAVGLTFEYSIAGSAVDEFMTMGIGTSNEYTMETKFLDEGAWNGTPVISVSDLRNQDVELVFALNGVNATPTGVLSIRNIQFYIPPRPQLSLEKTGDSLTATWPLSAQDWTIETTTDLSNPNSWEEVNQAPVDNDVFHTQTFDVTGATKAFFRLKK